MEPLLQVRNLTVHYCGTDNVEVRALEDVSLDIGPGESIGVLGPSGSGKTTLALALLRLLPETARIVLGSILFRGQDLLLADERSLERIRGAEVSIIVQDPAMALNPVMRVGDQIAEVVRAHAKGSRQSYGRKAESALAEVGLCDRRIYQAYPHQLSAGQRQRIAIAQALVCRPVFLIADEPTSALDNVTRAEILDLLKGLRKRLQIAFLFITHNPALLVGIADRVLTIGVKEAAATGNYRVC
jgi:peptide/nickel transport system ATP-binding protein